jgi:integrase
MYSTIYKKASNEFKSKKVNDMRFSILVLLGLESGARVSDLLSLTWPNIDFNQNEVSYQNKKSKKNQSQCLSENLIAKIKLFKEVCELNGCLNDYIFFNENKGTVMSRNTATRRANKEFGVSFHELRRVAAKRVANSKGVVMASKYLGHSKVSTTDIYLKVSDSEYKNQMRDLF